MRKILLSLFAIFALSLSASSLYDDIKPYVKPQNTVQRPAESVFLPDESATVQLASDGHTLTTCDIKTGDVLETIFDVATTREIKLDDIADFILSPDASKILVCRDVTPIYRRSSKAHWWVYDRHSRILTPLVSDGGFARNPLWSPDSRMVAFVTDDNNIRIRKIDYNTEVMVTTDGKRNSIINGAADWTYEEELYTTAVMAWAPDNLTFAFVKFNETDVPLYRFDLFQGSCDPQKEYEFYPGDFEYKYPLAGYPNSKVSLHAYDIETRRVKDIALPGNVNDPVEYIPRIDYSGSADCLLVSTLNRNQNRFEVFSVNPRATTAKSILTEQAPNGWIAAITYTDMRVCGDSFVLPSSRSGWCHLYQYTTAGVMQRQLTSGNFDVTAYYGYDAARKLHYYQAAPGVRNRTVVRLDEKGKTASLAAEEGTTAAVFSPKMSYATLEFSDISTPPRFALTEPAKGREIRLLEDNLALKTRFASCPKREFFTLPADAQGPELYGYIIRPKNFSASKQYPLIVFQYSGPESQEVRNKFSMDWQNFAAMQDFVVLCVDGRGTGARGRDFAQCVYKHLGDYETVDQLRAARYGAALPYVDAGRVGICGWSYGGYETLMAATAPGNPFKAAVSIAPVTDWRFYDTVYTERYMSTPQQNEDGYEEAAALTRVNDLNAKLLIMHGTSDDNVHLANTMEFLSRLISAGRYCDLFLFPAMNHSMGVCNARQLIYSRMLEYFSQNL